jgi:hypothetical protein
LVYKKKWKKREISRGNRDGPQCFYASAYFTAIFCHVTTCFVYFHFGFTVATIHIYSPLTNFIKKILLFQFDLSLTFCTILKQKERNIYINLIIYIDYIVTRCILNSIKYCSTCNVYCALTAILYTCLEICLSVPLL